MYVYMYVNVYKCLLMCLNVCLDVYVFYDCIFVYFVYTCIFMFMCVFVCIYEYMYVCYVFFYLNTQHAPLHYVILHAIIIFRSVVNVHYTSSLEWLKLSSSIEFL